MKKDFKNIVIVNLGHLYEAALEEDMSIVNEDLTRSRWFDYVVSDDVIDELRGILENSNVDNSRLKKIIYDDVINTRNVVYSSTNENEAINEAIRLSENNLILELT